MARPKKDRLASVGSGALFGLFRAQRANTPSNTRTNSTSTATARRRHIKSAAATAVLLAHMVTGCAEAITTAGKTTRSNCGMKCRVGRTFEISREPERKIPTMTPQFTVARGEILPAETPPESTATSSAQPTPDLAGPAGSLAGATGSASVALDAYRDLMTGALPSCDRDWRRAIMLAVLIGRQIESDYRDAK